MEAATTAPTEKPKKAKAKRLSQELYNSQQSWYYESIWNFMGEKVSISIRRNAYDFQSHRSASVYDPERKQWNALCSLSFEKAHCLPVSYVQKVADIKLFEMDEADLLKQAALVLG